MRPLEANGSSMMTHGREGVEPGLYVRNPLCGRLPTGVPGPLFRLRAIGILAHALGFGAQPVELRGGRGARNRGLATA